MGKTYRKHLSFQSGEISPLFFGRSDSEIYDKGLEIAENMIVTKQGGIRRRRGTQHVARITGDHARAFTLQVSRQRYYTIILHDLEMIIVAPGARILGNNLLLNGNFASAGDNWSQTMVPGSSQVIFSTGQARLLPEQNNPEIVSNGDFLQAGTNWIVRESHPQSDVTFTNNQAILTPRTQTGEFAGIAQLVTTTTPVTPHQIDIKGTYGNFLTVNIGPTEGDGSYLSTTIDQDTVLDFTPALASFFITLDCVFPDVTVTLDSVSIKDNIVKTAQISQQATVVALPTDPHLVIVGQHAQEVLHVRIGTTEGAGDILDIVSTDQEITEVFTPNSATYWVSVLADGDDIVEGRISFVGTAAEVVAGGVGLTMAAPWTEDQLPEVHKIESPEGRTLYFTHPNVPVQKLIYDFAGDFFVPLSTVSFLSPPPEWTGTNHPATGAHFQGRLWLAGSPDQRQTIWASVPNSPEDFTDSGMALATDPLEIVLQDFGRIEWMLGTKNLLVGTENGEHIITSEGGVIIIGDTNIERQSAFGSNNMQAIQVGEKVFYLTPDGRKLRAMAYEWQEDNWLSQDLTFVSEHITEGIGRHSAWAQNPDNLFVLMMEDGTVSILTYDRTAQAVAWTRNILSGLQLFDVTSGRDDGVNEAVFVGQRVAGFIDIEFSSPETTFLDSSVSVFDGFGTNVITGLDHLEGVQVRPIVDGAVEPLVVVVGGQITTQATGNSLTAGIPYTSMIKTLPIDSVRSDQQTRSFTKRWNKVWALLFKSKQPLINGIRPPDRTPSTPMNTVEPDKSGHFKTVNLGWDDFGQITIAQDLPVDLHILAIYGEVVEETL